MRKRRQQEKKDWGAGEGSKVAHTQQKPSTSPWMLMFWIRNNLPDVAKFVGLTYPHQSIPGFRQSL